jgi:hypothetical protein
MMSWSAFQLRLPKSSAVPGEPWGTNQPGSVCREGQQRRRASQLAKQGLLVAHRAQGDRPGTAAFPGNGRIRYSETVTERPVMI